MKTWLTRLGIGAAMATAGAAPGPRQGAAPPAPGALEG